MTFGQNLRKARLDKGYTQRQLANLIGAKHNSVSNWENDQNLPERGAMESLCETLGVTMADLFSELPESGSVTVFERSFLKKYRSLDEHGRHVVDLVMREELTRMEREREKYEQNVIPLMHFLTPVSAGSGVLFGSDDFENLEVVSNSYTRSADFCLTVEGCSMEPKYMDGDIILVKEQADVDFGEIGVFLLDGRGYVKQKGEDRLISLNPDLPDVYPEEYGDLRCAGKVVGTLDPDWIQGGP